MSQRNNYYPGNKTVNYSPMFKGTNLNFANKNKHLANNPSKRNIILKKETWQIIQTGGTKVNKRNEIFHIPDNRKLFRQTTNNGKKIDEKIEFPKKNNIKSYENNGNGSCHNSEKEGSQKIDLNGHRNSRNQNTSHHKNFETIQYSDNFESNKNKKAIEEMKKTLGEIGFIMYYLWEKIDNSMEKFFQSMQNQNNIFISEFFKKQRIENNLFIIRFAKTMGYKINMEDFKEDQNYSR